MKKTLTIILILCGFSAAYAQDLIKEIQKLTLENDSLQKQVIIPLSDSIVRLNSDNVLQMSKLQQQIKILDNHKRDLQ